MRVEGEGAAALVGAFRGWAALAEEGRAALAEAFVRARDGGREDLREAFEEALGHGWDRAGLSSWRLGDLMPGAGGLPDDAVPANEAPRVVNALDRAGRARWSALLDCKLSDIESIPNVGPLAVRKLLGMCFGRSLEGLAAVHSGQSDQFAVLLDHERVASSQPLLRALLDACTGDQPPAVRLAAQRLLSGSAPWAVDHEASLARLLESAGSERDLRVFTSCSLHHHDRLSLQTVARELGISSTRVGELRDRAEARVRSAASSPQLSWLVTSTRRRLGAVATEHDVEETLAELGVRGGDPPTGELLVWLAGPYEPVPARPGWLALDGRRVLTRTVECLAADGGVRRLVDVDAELGDLGVTPKRLRPWMRACGASIVEELSVSVVGRLSDAVERVLDAYGRPASPLEVVDSLGRGGVSVDPAALEPVLRARRFCRLDSGEVALRDWGDLGHKARPPRKGDPPPSTELRLLPPGAPGAADDDAGAQYAGRSWLWVRVDEDALRGAEATVPPALVAQAGVGQRRRRTFSSRYGPITLANDGATPTRGPVRAIALAAGAASGDTLLLGFAPTGDVEVEVRQPSAGPPDSPPITASASRGAP